MVDVSKFVLLNVADTCSIWNLLAAQLLYARAKSLGLSLCCTEFVRYECLHKPGVNRPERVKLQERFRSEEAAGRLKSFSIDLEDLQDIEILDRRRRVSKGELASIIFAKKTQQAFLTDDRKAAKLAITTLPTDLVQSTCQLVGWLAFEGYLSDGDKDTIVNQLAAHSRSLQPHLDAAFQEAFRCRSVVASSSVEAQTQSK